MQNKIKRPENPYSKLWDQYWKENPHLHRSVGADAVNEPTIESLQAEMATLQAESKKATEALAAQNKQLLDDNEKWKGKQTEAEKHRKEQERAAKEAIEEAARKSGDVKALENSWNEKYSTLQNESGQTIESLNKIINDVTVVGAAKAMAASISMDGCSDIVLPHIEKRMYSEIIDGKAVLKIRGADGGVSALTPEELAQEFSNNKNFERVMKGSSANGGGAAGGGSGGDSKSISDKEWRSLNPTQQAQLAAKGVFPKK